MATHDYSIANQSFPSFRTDLNNALLAIQSSNSSASAPTSGHTTGQLFFDTSTSNLKVYNGSAWVEIGHDLSTVMAITNTTAATSTTTGALKVTGGISTQNNLYVGGTINSTGSITGNLTGSATSLATGRTIGMTGHVTWTSASFNGSGNVTGTSTISTTAKPQVAGLGVGTAASTTTGEIRATNNITAYYSDDRLKIKLGNIPNALDKTLSLNGFNYIENKLANSFGYNSGENYVGISAQEVQKVLPEAVKPAPFDLDESNNSKSGENYLTVQYEKLVPLLIESIKDLNNKIQELEAKLIGA